MGVRLVAGRYRLVRELGRGGMGVVWLAEDQLVGRQVAVKELRPPQGLADHDREVHARRALQEARSAARVHHPGAVELYDVLPATETDDAVYLIMELVEGPTLAEIIERGGALPAPQVAAFGLQLLSVLDAAHALGVVHRDIKPANIIVAGRQAKLTDFGIAHSVGDPRLTRTGVMGTQAYLAPELFESGPITPAADLWSLGATLCNAAEGRGPFERATTGATLRAILIDDLPALTCAPPLAAAITGLLQRDPARRATTSQVRACLQQAAAQAGLESLQPGPAPQPPPPGSTWPPAPRPTPAVGPQPTWQQARTTLSPSSPPPPRQPVPGVRKPGDPRSGRRLPVIAAVTAAALVVSAAVVVPVLVLKSGPASPHHRPGPRASSSYPAAGSYPAVTLTDPGGSNSNAGVMSVAFSPGDKTLAVGDGDDRTYLWDVATHRIIATLTDPGTGPHPGVDSVAFSPDGQTLAVGDDNGRAYLWDLATRSITTTLANPGRNGGVGALAFSPDGQTLAVPEADGSTYLWDVATGQLAAKLTDTGGSDPSVSSVAFSPDGQTLAAGDEDSITYLWNVATHRSITTLTDPAGSMGVGAVAFSPDGQTLAVADGNGNCYLWDVATGQLTATIADPQGTLADPQGGESVGVDSVAFSPDGRTLAFGDGNNNIYLWNRATRRVVGTMTDPGSNNSDVFAIAFSQDGKTLATSDEDSTYLWKL
jgi:serine/threonine protein kinase/Tol biopolymer transport system component